MEYLEIKIKRNGEEATVKLPADATVGDVVDSSLSLIAKSGYDKMSIEMYLLDKAYDLNAVFVK
jgi:hypothetical protein